MLRSLILALTIIVVGTVGMAQQYTLKPGDSLSVEVLEDPTLNRAVMVLPDGNITFPFVGTIKAEGRTIDQVGANIAAALSPNFASRPTVFVSLSTLNPATASQLSGAALDLIDIYFLGEVNSPGLVQVPEGTTLLQALALSGGLTNFAATKRIQLRRTDTQGAEVVYTFDYNAILSGAKVTGTTSVADGDVILVPQRRLFE